MEYLKLFGWMLVIPVLFGIVFIVIPLLIKDWLSKKFPVIGVHFDNHSSTYKKIIITCSVIVVLYWYFSQPSDGRICVSQDHYGCIEWEYTDEE